MEPIRTAADRRREKILQAVAFTAQAVLHGLPWRRSVQQALERFGDAAGVSRVYVFRSDDGGRRVSQMFEWVSDGVEPQIDNPMLQDVATADVGMQRWIDLLSVGEAIHGPVAEMPESERELLEAQEIRSLAVVPIFVEDAFWGFVGFDDCTEARRWSEAELDGLRSAAGMLGAALYRERAEVHLRDSEKRFRELVENVPGVFYLCHLDERFSMVYLSDKVEELSGHPARDFLSGELSLADLCHPDDRLPVLREVRSAIEERRAFLVDYRLLHADGSYRWIEGRGQGVWDDDGELRYLEGTMVDVSERKAAEERLVHDAFHDPLTNLPNRKLFRDRVERAMARARRRGELFAVVYLDLDRFKLINDGLGHRAGDELLLAIGERLSRAVRHSDTVARLGGDEFAVLFQDLADPSDAVRRAERLQKEFERPFLVDGHVVLTSATMGIAVFDQRYQRPDQMLRDADLAMYRAKAKGDGQRLVFDPEMARRAMERLDLESALRDALELHEFVLHYQPIVSLADGLVEGAEALVRWRHPQRGLLHPAAFLGVLEETGLIVSLGQWVLDEACSALEAWRRRWPGLTVNVNLRGREFAQGDLVAIVEQALTSHGLPPQALNLELTEGVVMDETAAADRVLADLRRLGVGLVIDDFGVGYSSLSCLHRLPIDAVKAPFNEEEGDEELLRSIAALARALSLRVVAERVERDADVAALRRLGFDAAQGFRFARPVDRAGLEAALVEGLRW